MKTFTCHDPDAGPEGTDLLIRIYDDGTGDFASRPGRDQRWITWGPPIPMQVAS